MTDGDFLRQQKDRIEELEAALVQIRDGMAEPWVTDLINRTLDDVDVLESEVTAEEMLPDKE